MICPKFSRTVINRSVLLLFLVLIGIIVGCQKIDGNNKEEVKMWVGGQFGFANQDQLKQTQEEVDQGHRLGLLHPNQVAREFLLYALGIQGDPPLSEEISEGGKKVIRFDLENGKVIKMKLVQPVKQGREGIWAIESYWYEE